MCHKPGAAFSLSDGVVSDNFTAKDVLDNVEVVVSTTPAKLKPGEHQSLYEDPTDVVEFELIGIDAPIANALRRIMISEVASVAIEKVVIMDNTSIMQDEVLAHRLGQVPMAINPDQYEFRGEEEPYTDNNTVVFTLDVDCRRVDGEIQPPQGLVTTDDLRWKPINPDTPKPGPAPHPAYSAIPLMKLCPGQAIHVELYCEKGIGRDHAKFSPVGTAVYRLLPEIRVHADLEDAAPAAQQIAKEIIAACPLSGDRPAYSAGAPPVYGLTANGGLRVEHPRSCTMCRECVNVHADSTGRSPHVQLLRKKDHYLFRVEGTGVMRATDIFRQAIAVLKEKCQKVRDTINDNVERKTA